MLNKIMVANRGEIACRVLRTCKAMQISSVAIYSEEDKEAPHVSLADEAFCIGPPKSTESYLNMGRIIQVAVDNGVDTIHPGYGFLAENFEFALRCEEAGIKLVAPGSEAMKAMGNKSNARQLAKSKEVPTIPGTENCISNYEDALDFAMKVGFPIMVKPALGGGGIGMKIARDENDLKEAVEAGISLAQSAFGDSAVYLEKLVDKPRHVEVQILADHYGNILHLFERECSIQRRHQKLVEEAPSQQIDSKLRSEICHAAILVAQACGYTNAGTVEFLLDPMGNYYFMEMNTRLQVEHPVTEMTTGIDIVELQIMIAAGKKLPYVQTEVKQKGHAIECRIYAEDPENNFFPSWGTITKLSIPTLRNVRTDIGCAQGGTVSYYYDPLIGKLIVWGETRAKAIETAEEALKDFRIEGITTTIPLCIEIMRNGCFQRGEVSTDFLQRHFGLG